ncbi:MAG: metal dependent phosphohydrolase [Limisphaerales bacterium]|nr:MAG: metal dependent phosphohydrolase [Limisphaerales bacterium]KAG0507673.1 MAG: metal dependent phosphohydrolase [Limisphaerales bacterium]TXT51792.1 MAG: metal dependent phosphohydrolase [Limisphaerales bacterium]
MSASPEIARYLEVNQPAKRWVGQRLITILNDNACVPSFSSAVMKLVALTQRDDVDTDELVAVIGRDVGLATNCIRVASSAFYSSGTVATLNEAVFRLGLREVRRIACSVGVMDRFRNMRLKVDWRGFWLHSLVVARLCDRIARAFRQSSGMEYLAGLMHDSGKLLLQHHLPQDFEEALMRSWTRKRGHYLSEREIFGLDHTQVGAALCHRLKLHPQICTAILFHHTPEHPGAQRLLNGDQGFLATVTGFADALAHVGAGGLGGERKVTPDFENWPEWGLLQRFEPVYGLDLDLAEEVAAAERDLQSFEGQ